MRTLLITLMLLASAHAQEFCKHCPTAAQMNIQFGPEPGEQQQKIFTKLFIGTETLHALAISTDAFITLKRENPRRGCLEGSNGFPELVRGRELAVEGAAEFGFSLGLGMLLHHTRPPKAFRFLPFMAPAWGSTIHIVGATRWYRNCPR